MDIFEENLEKEEDEVDTSLSLAEESRKVKLNVKSKTIKVRNTSSHLLESKFKDGKENFSFDRFKCAKHEKKAVV